MLVLARRVEHAFDVTVQGSHDADAREHRRAVTAIRKTRLHIGRRKVMLNRGRPMAPASETS
jgi:hypothetical protein